MKELIIFILTGNEPKLTFTNIIIESNERGLLVIMDKKKPDSYSDSSKKIVQNINVNVNCCDNKKITRSAFRAVNGTVEQNVPANTPIFPVLYPDEIFDLNNEYDPDTSTFSPKQDGLYLIIASVAFFPDDNATNYRVVINIRVNDIPVVTDNGFFGADPVATGDEASVSAILQLAAADELRISIFSTTNGILLPEPRGTHFEAARIPSPVTQ